MIAELYRYESASGVVYVTTLPVIKTTPAGRWVDEDGRKRFIRNKGRKRYAWETLELALESFIKRKERQQGILEAQLENVKQALEVATKQKDELLDRSRMLVVAGIPLLEFLEFDL